MLAKSARDLPPEGWIYNRDECERCPFAKPCQEIRGDIPAKDEPLTASLTAEIIALAHETKGWQKKAKTTLAAQRQSEHALKELLRAHRRRKVDDGTIAITWSSVRGHPSYDWPAIRDAAARAGIDLNKFQASGEPTDRLVIKRKFATGEKKFEPIATRDFSMNPAMCGLTNGEK